VFEKKTRLALVFLTGYIQELQLKWIVWLRVSRVADSRKNLCLCSLLMTKAPGIPKSGSTLNFSLYVMVFMPSKLFISPCLRHAASFADFPTPDPAACHIYIYI
jgi:hypothetical protein